jgi:hypothetical protein
MSTKKVGGEVWCVGELQTYNLVPTPYFKYAVIYFTPRLRPPAAICQNVRVGSFTLLHNQLDAMKIPLRQNV